MKRKHRISEERLTAFAFLMGALILALSGCSDPVARGGMGACVAAEDCATAGEVCIDEMCTACSADSDCEGDPAFGLGATCNGGACVPCVAGGVGCQCAAGGTCDPGFLCDSGSTLCRAPLGCGAAGCAANQECQAPTMTVDAVCLDSCSPGFVWNGASMTCDATPANCAMGDPQSILAACDAAHRACEETGSFASCGGCQPTYVENPASLQCELLTMCSQLTCAAQNRDCIADPTPRCIGCLPFFVADGSGGCRAVTTCNDLNCTGTCNAATATSDASCGGMATCAADQVPIQGSSPLRCATCNCGTMGVTPPGATGGWESSRASMANELCVCTTLADFYFDETTGKPEPCDEDQDGWLVQSARTAVQSTDSLIQDNARCVVRRATSIVLENDPGVHSGPQQYTAYNGSPIDLYESGVIDDPDDSNLPRYQGTVPLRAEQLNSFTKACTGSADANGDGLTDAAQATTSVGSPLDPNFVSFAYFMETHRAWFEPESSIVRNADGPTIATGSYHIREKTRQRTGTAPSFVAAAYPADAARNITVNAVPFVFAEVGTPTPGYWQQCLRQTHPDALASQPGWDFSGHGPGVAMGFLGMTHQSQFRCVVMDNAFRNRLWDGAPATATVDPATLDASLRWNDCVAVPDAMDSRAVSEATVVDGEAVAPRDALFDCTARDNVDATSLPQTSSVGWVLTRYINHAGVYKADAPMPGYGAPSLGYQGGCINECVQQQVLGQFGAQCAGFGDAGQACEDEEYDDGGNAIYNFGKLVCGCAPNYGGANCEIPCAGDQVHTELPWGQLLTVGRANMGYWMCGGFAATDGTVLEENAGMPSSGYALRGKIAVDPPGSMGLVDHSAFTACTDPEPASGTACLGKMYGLSSDGCRDSTGEPCYSIRATP